MQYLKLLYLTENIKYGSATKLTVKTTKVIKELEIVLF